MEVAPPRVRRSGAKLPWLVVSVTVVAVMFLPLGGILAEVFAPPTETWHHIVEYLLLDYVRETVLLTCGTLLTTVTLASALAWVVTAYDFPGRRFVSVALVLPLAIPAYIGGYTYVGLTGYTGAIHVWLREDVGWTPPAGFLNIMNLPGAVGIFTLFLYPYVYIVVRAFLDRQANQLVEAARTLGASRARTYWAVVLPLTRNAVIAGATLVAFEVLSDYGVVSYFGLNVFTTAIFKSWLSFNDIASAMRLAGILLLIVTVVTISEKALRGARSHSYSSSRVTPLVRQRATGLTLLAILTLTYGVIAFALVVPVIQMMYWAFVSYGNIRLDGLVDAVVTTLAVALTGAAITTILAVIVANHQRLWPSKFSRFLARVTVVGYSVPSTVIALSILTVAIAIDTVTGWGLILTPGLIIVAYVIRYLAVSMQSVEAGFEKIGTQYVNSARTMGHGPLSALLRVDIPMMRSAIAGAFLLAFIDMVKELPIVLILRPFNFSTLSTTVFQYANDEMIPESSLASLIIILLAMIPLAAFAVRSPHTRERQGQ